MLWIDTGDVVRVDEAIASLRAQIAAIPGDDSDADVRRLANATRLARIGRLLERKDLVKEGLAAARVSLSLGGGPEGYDARVKPWRAPV